MNRYPIILAALALVSGPAFAAPLQRLPGAQLGVGPIKAVSVHPDAARIPSLGQTLPPTAAVGAAAQDPAKPAIAGLQGEVVRIEAAAQSGQTEQGGRNPSFDGGSLPKTDDEFKKILELNKAIAEVLAPFNNQLTKATVHVSQAQTNATRAVAFDATVDYSKKGPDGDAAIKIDRLVYAYPDGGEPKTDARIGLEFNLLNVLSRDQINKLGPDADKMVANFLADYAKRYGAAATLDARITRKDVDAQGNLTALSLTLGIKVDLSKLPAKVDPKSVEFTEAKLDLAITLQGADIAVAVTSNPKHRSFENGQQGLKEYLDGLLARDPKQLRSIKRFIEMVDSLGAAVTDKSRRLRLF